MEGYLLEHVFENMGFIPETRKNPKKKIDFLLRW